MLFYDYCMSSVAVFILLCFDGHVEARQLHWKQELGCSASMLRQLGFEAGALFNEENPWTYVFAHPQLRKKSQANDLKAFKTPELINAGYTPEELHLGNAVNGK